jgi:hypothetical protein
MLAGAFARMLAKACLFHRVSPPTQHASMRVLVCFRVLVRACVRASERACVRASVRAWMARHPYLGLQALDELVDDAAPLTEMNVARQL